MTLEEYCIVSKCNGVFAEAYRPDCEEEQTEKDILNIMIARLDVFKNKISTINYQVNEGCSILDLWAEELVLHNNDIHEEPRNLIYQNNKNILLHNPINSECKNSNEIKIKKGNLDFFRTAVFATTRRENFFLITNTSRKTLKQTGDGHFSPVAAYHKKSDHVLLLDAARFKYNSMWFQLNLVYDAFKGLDNSTNKTRGFILCSRYF